MFEAAAKVLIAAVAALGAAVAMLAVAQLATGLAWPGTAAATVTAILTALVLAASEARRVRGLLFWGAAGGLIAAGVGAGGEAGFGRLAIFAAAGVAAGFVYWRLAGRSAGGLAAAISRARGRGDPIG